MRMPLPPRLGSGAGAGAGMDAGAYCGVWAYWYVCRCGAACGARRVASSSVWGAAMTVVGAACETTVGLDDPT